MNRIHYKKSTQKDLHKILTLQQKNLKKNLAQSQIAQQGYVTIHHTLEQLQKLNDTVNHIVAIDEDKNNNSKGEGKGKGKGEGEGEGEGEDGGEVIGYCLAMTAADRDLIPIIVPMFQCFDGLDYRGRRIGEYRYIVGGQVCVEEAYRGKGVFGGMLDFYKKCYQAEYDFMITEIALDNPRSINAHKKQGFIEIKRYQQGDVQWSIVIWPWKH